MNKRQRKKLTKKYASRPCLALIESEREQENAVEVLTKAGFVLDDEDGETWTKEGVMVKIECVHPSESKYKWEYDGPSSLPETRDTHDFLKAHYGTGGIHFGVSGEFHRLLALISGEVKS